MRRAIALSAAGLDGTSPNPLVECVLIGLVGQIVGEAITSEKARPAMTRSTNWA